MDQINQKLYEYERSQMSWNSSSTVTYYPASLLSKVACNWSNNIFININIRMIIL